MYLVDIANIFVCYFDCYLSTFSNAIIFQEKGQSYAV